MVFDLDKRIAVIRSCANMKVPLEVIVLSNPIKCAIYSDQKTVIQPQSHIAITIWNHQGLPANQNFLFEPECSTPDAVVYTHVVDHNLMMVFACNDLGKEMVIPQGIKLGNIVEYKANGCFRVNPQAAINSTTSSTASTMTKNWARTAMRALLAAATTYHIITDTNTNNPESKLSNRITVYGNSDSLVRIQDVIAEFPKL